VLFLRDGLLAGRIDSLDGERLARAPELDLAQDSDGGKQIGPDQPQSDQHCEDRRALEQSTGLRAHGTQICFGLQEIFANFVSGLIILFERPIRVGDTVTIDDVSGTVTRIRIRATWITAFDRKELVVPNKEFVTSRLINWSLSDPVLRVDIPVGIAYGSDTQKALEVLLDVARRNEHVLQEPRPNALFLGFGDSSLNFELRAFSPDIEHLLLIRHQLHMAIDAAFREAGIEIAFPQRDIHIRSVPGPLPAPEAPGGTV